MLIDLIIYQN